MKFPDALSSLAEQAILDARNDQSIVSSAKDGEVSHVAKVVLHLPDALVNLWAPFLKSGTLTVQSVFCHKTPKAKHYSDFKKKNVMPEFGDLLLITNLQSGGADDRRAMLLQAKMGNQNGNPGEFDLASGGDAIQRAMYAHWPSVGLTGLGKRPRPIFNLAPNPPGSCKAARYACIDPSPSIGSSGWSIEDSQPNQVPPYCGRFQAKVPLGDALVEMLSGELGASLISDPEWSRAVAHLIAVANLRDSASRKPPDVVVVSGVTKAPHTSQAMNLMADDGPSSYFGINNGNYPLYLEGNDPLWRWSDQFAMIFRKLNPKRFNIHGPRVPIDVEEGDRGFGVIFVGAFNPVWREDLL